MSNRVDNELTLRGDHEEISTFVRRVIKYDHSASHIPGLEELLESGNPMPPPSVLSRGLAQATLTVKESETVYVFETVWSHPIRFVIAVSRCFPHVVFHLNHFSTDNREEGDALIVRGEVWHSRHGPVC